ncbi:hypothetical protein [Deinococcus pimensis]|uniref:hypothetical protein n=1 Tax=Deinococcus pimensis TaxID=309888 RepID=UPI0004845364|nr:hypothetical protein [Deinococcus pimensis]
MTNEKEVVEKRIAGITKAEFEQLQTKHGDRLEILSLGPDDTDVIVRPPRRAEYDRYVLELAKGKARPDVALAAGTKLVKACLVVPTEKVFDDLLEKYPAMGDQYSEEVLKLIAADAEVQRKSFR